LQTDRSQF